MADVHRNVLERYLAELQALGRGEHHQRMVGQLGIFLTGIRRHHWDASLHADAVLFTEDVPRQAKRLPRPWPSTSWHRSKIPPTSTGGRTLSSG
ncbi:hypothetical protein GCM10009799_41320 [Nocardiopsis rhodophaea]|uniref:Uncharacterized protein n=1 Tax=Nocardiopsis rhodophaea TaxID=280238 RepID=A0ABN2TGW9_9ACTN